MRSNLLVGLIPLLKLEISKWFGTKKFVTSTTIWILVFNGFIFYVLNNQESFAQSGMQFGNFDKAQLYTMPVGMFGVFGSIILMHSVISGEIENGIASWVLSKPVSRLSYLLSKYLANTIGIFLSMIPVQSFITYLLLTGPGSMDIPVTTFVLVVTLLFIHILFFISLTLLCNVFTNSRIAILAIPFSIFFVQQYAMNLFSKWSDLFPYKLIVNATVLLAGESVSYLPSLLFTLSIILLSILLSIFWLYRKEF